MSFDVRVGVFGETGFAIREVPTVFPALPVAKFAPLVTFAGVLPFGPLAEFPVQLAIHSIEDTLGGVGAVIVRPAPDTRIERGDERGLVTPALGADARFHLFQVAFCALRLGRMRTL